MSLLQQELERSFGDGPAHRPLEETLRSGRRTLRRRRAGVAAGALAVLVSIGTVSAVVADGSGPRTSGEVVTEPSPSPSPTPSDAGTPASDPWGRGEKVRYSASGELEVRPGVEVHEHIENPFTYQSPQRSDALDITFRGRRTWLILELWRGDLRSSESTPSNGWASFADYVADQAGTTIERNGWPATVRLTAEGSVVPADGAEVLQRTDDPRLGDSFAPPGTPTGAALVRPAGEDQAYFVVWRVLDGTLDVLTTPPFEVVGSTFPELLAFARSQYASGEGLR